MSAIIPFDFEEQAVRVIMRDGEPWFVAADVCRVLEIQNPTQAVQRLDDDEMTLCQTEGQTGQRGGARSFNIVSESGLYALVLRSDKPNAKAFRKWITAEVLPAIRRDGRYEHIAAPAEQVEPLSAARDGEFWLSLIREARLLGGTKAGRAMWARSPLPPLMPPPISLAVDPAQGRACLDHLLAHDDIRGLINAALDGDQGAACALGSFGLRLKAEGLFVANANHPGIERVFAGTRWAGGHHKPALLALPGVMPTDKVYNLAGVTCRGIMIPGHVAMGAAYV
jgi:hypothetical protein